MTKTVGQMMKQERLKRGYTKSYVAKAIGISLATYTKYENDITSIKISAFLRLADFYNVKFHYLLGR